MAENGGIKCATEVFIATTPEGDAWIHKPSNRTKSIELGFLASNYYEDLKNL